VLYDQAAFIKAGLPLPAEVISNDDLANVGKQLNTKLGKDYYAIDATVSLDFSYYIRQKGASLFSKEGFKLGYDNDQYLSDFFKLKKSFTKNGIMGVGPTDQEKESLIVRGIAAFVSNTSNRIVVYNQLANRTLKLMPLPVVSGVQEGNYLKPSMFLSMSSYSKKKDAAVKFIDFFMNDIPANEILSGERGVPISKKVREDLLAKVSDVEKEQYTYIQYVSQHSKPIDPPAPKGSSKVINFLNRLSSQVNDDAITPDDAAKQFREGAEAILKEENL
jgi:multiple sugar transport system substrate-binding protein